LNEDGEIILKNILNKKQKNYLEVCEVEDITIDNDEGDASQIDLGFQKDIYCVTFIQFI